MGLARRQVCAALTSDWCGRFQAPLGAATPGQMDLGGKRKVSECELGEKASKWHSSMVPASVPAAVPALTSFALSQIVSQISPFLHEFLLAFY